MKAIVLHEYGPASNLIYEDFPDPKPTAGEVLVRVSATSINPADWLVRSGAVKDIIPVAFPYIPGCDLAGIVVEVGEGVTSFTPGDHVMAITLHTYAEFSTVPASILAKIPEGLEMTTATALPLVTLTGDNLVRRGANVQPGQTVLITGAVGSVGRSAVFAAAQLGAHVIAGVRSRQIDTARQLPGVSEAIAIDDDAAIDQLGPLDSVADTIGGELADRLLVKVKPGGTFGCFPKREPQNASLHPTIHINIVFEQANSAMTSRYPEVILRYAEAVRDGRLTIPIGRIMPLAEAAEAQVIAEQGGIGKVVLTA